MALSSSVYGSVATPRIFIDYVQYCRTLGIPIGYYDSGFGGETFQKVWYGKPVSTTSAFTQPSSHYNDSESDYYYDY